VDAAVTYYQLTHTERLAALAKYNHQRDKSHAEKLREAMQKINPDDAYQKLREDRKIKQGDLEENIVLGDAKKRKKITTTAFLTAAQKAVESERAFWPVTCRRIHYLLLNDPPFMHDKKPGSVYQNTKNCYSTLTNLLTRARLTGDIPPGAVEDETRPCSQATTFQSAADFISNRVDIFLRGYQRDLLRGQQNHVEILVEKNAIRKHVEMVADEYCLPCTTTRGYCSLTPRENIVKRFTASGKSQLILLILSDHDPDGDGIAASICCSLRDDYSLMDVKARKVLLSAADVLEHNLPSDMEAKVSSPNYRKFVEKYGVNVAELDAAPVALIQGKLRDAIEGCLDMDLFKAEEALEKEDAAVIAATKEIVRAALAGNNKFSENGL